MFEDPMLTFNHHKLLDPTCTDNAKQQSIKSTYPQLVCQGPKDCACKPRLHQSAWEYCHVFAHLYVCKSWFQNHNLLFHQGTWRDYHSIYSWQDIYYNNMSVRIATCITESKSFMIIGPMKLKRMKNNFATLWVCKLPGESIV